VVVIVDEVVVSFILTLTLSLTDDATLIFSILVGSRRALSLTFHFTLYSSPFFASFSQLASPACFVSLCGLCSLRSYG
jgi:hypothetical protein